MKTISKIRTKPSVRDVYCRLIKYILKNGLAEGDPLPPHELLRKELKVGNDTLSQAIQLLTYDGVLKTVRRVNTVVADPSKASIHLWTVALAMPPEISAFSSLLQAYLHQSLSRNGCADRTYVRPHESQWIIEDEHPASDFTGLEQAAASGEVDAIISRDKLICKYVPVCRVSHHDVVFGITYETMDVVKDSQEVLARRGVARPLIVMVGEKQTSLPIPRLPFACMETKNDADWLRISKQPEARQGLMIAEYLLSLPSKQRPSGIICSDDHVTLGISAGLIKDPAYRPLMTSLSNRQLPLPFLLPVIRYEMDIEALAEKTIEVLTQGLLSNNKIMIKEKFPLKRLDPDRLLG